MAEEKPISESTLHPLSIAFAETLHDENHTWVSNVAAVLSSLPRFREQANWAWDEFLCLKQQAIERGIERSLTADDLGDWEHLDLSGVSHSLANIFFAGMVFGQHFGGTESAAMQALKPEDAK